MANLLLMLAVVCSLAGQVTPNVSDECKTSSSGGCFWTDYVESGMNYTAGTDKCAEHDSVLAVIPDQKTYDEIVEDAREKIRKNNEGKRGATGFLTGMTYDPSNNEMNPDGAFNGTWKKGFPKSNPDFTRVLVSVRLDPTSSSQGLRNKKPRETQKHKGVICQKPISDCQVTYDGKCYWIMQGELGRSMTFNAGGQYCALKGGTVGDIFAKSQYDQIAAIMRDLAIASDGEFKTWIGLKFIGFTMTLSDGSPAPYVNWAPGYPNSEDPNMAIVVKSDQAYPYQYMQNFGRSYMEGVLCVK